MSAASKEPALGLDDDFGFGAATVPATTAHSMAAVDHDAIADDVTVAQVQTRLQSIADVGASIIVAAGQLEVTGKDSAEAATDTAKQLKTIGKRIEEARKAAVKPFNEIVDEINATAKRYAAPFDTTAKQLGNKVVAWQNAENARIAAERRKQAEEAAAALLANKKPEPVIAPLPKEAPKPISTRVTYSYEITDFEAVPKEYKKLVIDEEKLGRDVRTQQVKAVPGVKIIRTETPVFR